MHSLSLGFAPVFASPARFFNPNVSWRALNEKGLFVGRLFSREFDDLVSAEAFNISVNGASALVPLSRQLIRTLQEMCDLKLLSANPLIGQVVKFEWTQNFFVDRKFCFRWFPRSFWRLANSRFPTSMQMTCTFMLGPLFLFMLAVFFLISGQKLALCGAF